MIANTETTQSALNVAPYSKYLSQIKKYFIPIFIALIVAASWVGVVDRQSENYVNGALKQALIVYGTARAVNSVISVLQTVSIPGVTIGEALDPVNDLVERFSAVMEIAIGSLVIQKVLVEITTNDFFKYALTLSGIALLVSIYFRFGTRTMLFSKIFITFVFLRFAVVLALLLNGVVDDRFIDRKVSADLTAVQTSTPAISVEEEQPTPKEPAAAPAPSDSGAASSTADGQIVKEGWMEKFKGKIEKKLEQGKILVQKLNPKLLKDKINSIVPNLLNLMAVFVLKSIILPIFFFYLMKHVIFLTWNIRFEDLFKGKEKGNAVDGGHFNA